MKLRLKFPYYKEPPKGWHWVRDGITFRAKSPEAVVEKVKQHLIANSQAPVGLMDEYVNYVAENWPQLVKPSHEEEAPIYHVPIMDVLTNMYLMGGKPMINAPEKEEIEKRVKMCAACPHNRELRGDLDVLEAIYRRGYMLTKGNLNQLGYCALHLWDNRVATRWDKKLLQPFKREAVKSVPCWF